MQIDYTSFLFTRLLDLLLFGLSGSKVRKMYLFALAVDCLILAGYFDVFEGWTIMTRGSFTFDYHLRWSCVGSMLPSFYIVQMSRQGLITILVISSMKFRSACSIYNKNYQIPKNNNKYCIRPRRVNKNNFLINLLCIQMNIYILTLLQSNSNYSKLTHMDQHQGNVSETTLPSEQVDRGSNLSMNPNRSESNDRILQDAPKPQKSSDNRPIYSQKQVPHRTQSLDQNNHEIQVNSLLPPISNQPSQRRENRQTPNLCQSERKFQLKTFDEDWQTNLKKEEQERQKYNELINHNNDPLLSQNSQCPSNQHFLLSQLPKSQPSQTLVESSHPPQQNSHPLKQDLSNKEDQISNEVKYQHYGIQYSQIINQQSNDKSNKSSQSNLCNQVPLFEAGIKQDSQSNLLNFGFVLKGKRNGTQIKQNQAPTLEKDAGSNEVMLTNNVEQPMDIQGHPKSPLNHNSNASKQISNEFSIKIHGCDNKLVNSSSKDNDIYGVSNKSEQKLSSQVKDQHTQYNSQQVHVGNQEIKDNISMSLQQVIEEMQNICKGQSPQLQRSQQGVNLLKEHIDLLFLKPLTKIGEKILKDGQLVILLINIILLKETDPSRKQVLQKYLILTLVSNIQSHHHQFIEFQQSVVRSRTFSNTQNNNQLKQKGESLNGTKITMNESFNPPESQHIDNTVYAENGSAHNSPQKSSGENNDNEVHLNVPVKRVLRNRKVTVSPASGKITKKTKYKSKRKGKTTAKKNNKITFENQLNDSSVIQNQRELRSISRKPNKSISKSEAKKSAKKGQSIDESSQQEHLGSKFTYVLQENKKKDRKQLIQRRVSERLAQNSLSAQKKLEQRSGSKTKKRVSSGKKHEDQELDINYIKNNLRQLRIKSYLIQQNFQALTPKDREIAQLYKSYNSILEQQEQQEQSSTPPVAQSITEVEETRSISISASQGNSRARMEQFKKNLSKYKVSDFPVVVSRIVDPDINNHGLYALIELGKISQLIHHSKFALTPISTLATACKRHIEEDLKQAKRLVGAEKDNIVYLQPTLRLLELINAQKKHRKR